MSLLLRYVTKVISPQSVNEPCAVIFPDYLCWGAQVSKHCAMGKLGVPPHTAVSNVSTLDCSSVSPHSPHSRWGAAANFLIHGQINRFLSRLQTRRWTPALSRTSFMRTLLHSCVLLRLAVSGSGLVS